MKFSNEDLKEIAEKSLGMDAELARELLSLRTGEEDEEKTFPLMASKDVQTGPRRIPWSIAELAYGEYSRQYGNGQSLEELARRGGFGWCEMDMFLPGWRDQVSEICQLRQQLRAAQSEVESLKRERDKNFMAFADEAMKSGVKQEFRDQQISTLTAERDSLKARLAALKSASVEEVDAILADPNYSSETTEQKPATSPARSPGRGMRSGENGRLLHTAWKRFADTFNRCVVFQRFRHSAIF